MRVAYEMKKEPQRRVSLRLVLRCRSDSKNRQNSGDARARLTAERLPGL